MLSINGAKLKWNKHIFRVLLLNLSLAISDNLEA